MKIVKSLAAILAVSLILIGCASTKVDYAAKAEKNTPENSVLMVFVGLGTRYELSQINPDFPAECIPINEVNCFTTPMKPGSCYLVHKLVANENSSWYGITSMTGSLPFTYLNGSEPKNFGRGSRIVVPKKTGIQMNYLLIDVEALKASGAMVIGKPAATVEEFQKSSLGRRQIRKALKNAAKQYAGTAWEDEINKELEEWL